MARLKYDNTRLFIGSVLTLIVYLIVIPALWPQPRVDTELPSALSRDAALPVTVTVKTWHPNFSVRQVSFSVDMVSSTALRIRGPFVPVNIYENERVTSWAVGFGNRLSWPRRRTYRLEVPYEEFTSQGSLRGGTLEGTIDVTIDYTKVTMKSGSPSLSVKRSIPYSLQVGF